MADVETNGERPIPDLRPAIASPADNNLVDEDSDSDGRRHVSTSVSKTRASVHTPAEDREAMQQLKQRIDFSDHSVPDSSQSTPKKLLKEPAVESTSTTDSGAAEKHAAEEVAESVSVSTILSRLDTVRNYLKEAEQLHKQLQLKMGEAGAITQLSKISKLIEQLRHQESGYLGILMKVIVSAEDGEKQASSSDGSDCGRSNGTESNNDADGDDDGGDGDEGVDNVETANSTELQEGGNLSLRSEVAEGESIGDFLDQERELSVLREQHALLKKLLEHQRQLKDLELKQSALVEMKWIAEEKLAAECEELQSQQLKTLYEPGAEWKGTEEKDTENKDAEEKDAEHNGNDEKSAEGCAEPKNEEVEYRMLLNKLSELKARKSRVDHLLSLLSDLNISPEDLEGVQTNPEENSAGDVKLDQDQQFLAELEEGKNSSVPQGKEVQSVQSTIMKCTGDSQLRTANINIEKYPGHSTACKKPAEEDAKLVEYEDRLAEKQAELARLITQRNELMATQKELLRLQEQSLQDQAGCPKPTQEFSYKPTDVTVATWGGSTAPTDDTTSSVSVPVDLDETNDSLDEFSPLTDMLKAVVGSAEEEDRSDNKGTLEFRVDCHKLDQGVPHKIVTPANQLGSTGKKRKLDETGVDTCKVKGASTCNDPWFPQRLSTDETTQTTWPNATNNCQEQHITALQERLGFTSHMCSELLKGQNNLIYALCQYSESARHQASAHDQFIQLQQYHSQLQHYHQRLLSSYNKFGSDQVETECVNQNGLSNKSCQPTGKPERAEAHCEHSCERSEALPPPLPPLLFQSFMHPEYVKQEFPSSLQSSFPNRKWFYEQPSTGVSQVQPSVAGTAASSSYNFAATLPFEQARMQTGHLNTSSGVADSATQVQASSGPNTPGFIQNVVKSDMLPVTATNNFSPDSTGSTLRVSPDSMGNNKGSVDMSHGKMMASGLGSNSDKEGAAKIVSTKGTVIDKEKGGESLSSLPTSLPESLRRRGHAELLETPVFDTLRETIYSEVAQLIANNESRPHFLVELFRKLQLLNTDYLRQRVLYSIEDLIMRFLTEESVAREEFQMTGKTWTGDSASECTPSETALTDDEVVGKGQGPQEEQNCNAKYDYFEPVDSASSLSTPSEHPYDQFASLNLGNTVIRLDKAMANVQSMHIAEGSPVKKLLKDKDNSQLDTLQTSEVDTHVLDEKIRAVMIEVIPLLKENMTNDCTCELLARIRQYVGDLVILKEKEHKPEYIEKFAKQLDASLNATLTKFIGKKLEDCGEEILVDISEVLFNELAFFRLMQEVRGYFHHSEFRSVTSASQTTTDNDEEDAKVSKQLDLESPHVDQKTGGKLCDAQADENQNSSDRREAVLKGESIVSDMSYCHATQDFNLTEPNAVCIVSSDTQMAVQTTLQDQSREQGCSAVIASIEEREELAGQEDEHLSPKIQLLKSTD